MVWYEIPQWWAFLGFCLTLIGVMHLGYGDKYSVPMKALIGLSYPLPFLFFGLSPWMALIFVVFIGMFILSNKQGFWSKTFVWKIVEMSIGFVFGLTAAHFISIFSSHSTTETGEKLMIACGAVGAVGFPLGGTGLKFCRRFLMPIALTGLIAWGVYGQ